MFKLAPGPHSKSQDLQCFLLYTIKEGEILGVFWARSVFFLHFSSRRVSLRKRIPGTSRRYATCRVRNSVKNAALIDLLASDTAENGSYSVLLKVQ